MIDARRFTQVLGKWWFRPMAPGWLAAVRIVVGGYTLNYLASRFSMYGKIARTDESLFDPIGCLAFLDAPLTPIVCDVVLLLTLLFNVAFLLGWGFRVSGPLFAGLLLAVLTYRNSWSMIHHTDHLLVLHVFILAFARSADSLSVDALVRRIFHRRRQEPTAASVSGSCWRYGWPVQLMCAVTVSVYFLAGAAKICGPLGWSWMSGDALRSQMAADGLRKEVLGGGAPEILFLLIQHVWLFTVLGVLTLVVELGAPLAMFNRRIARVWTIVIFGFHWGIALTMDITFGYQLSAVAFASFIVRDFFPDRASVPVLLEKLRGVLSARRKTTASLTSCHRNLDST